jgi:predicted AAA+ superfamily ATPase
MIPISETEILGRLNFDNPWWETSKIEKRFNDFQPRAYFSAFQKLVTDKDLNRAIVLMGPRRVGKTVLVYHSVSKLIADAHKANSILYVSLETPIYTGLSLEKIVKIFSKLHKHNRDSELYIFFDEIQYLKNWEVHLKSLVDSFPAYKFVATGSAAAALRLKSQESGAGRFTDFLLPPLTFHEYLVFTKQKETLINTVDDGYVSKYTTDNIDRLNASFIDYLNFGGYPEAVFSDTVKQDISRFIKSDIIDKVLLRDLPNLYGINDIQELNKLFTVIAYNTGQEVSLEALSQGAGISKNTLKRYIEYLEAAFLIKIVSRVDQSAKKFKRATHFKVYLTNPSMRAALFGPISEDSEAIGALVETAIYSQWFHSATIYDLHYARWKDGEVDIVYLASRDQKPYWCVEVKWSDLPYTDNRKLKSLVEFLDKNTLGQDAALVTTLSVNGTKTISEHSIDFTPSALYAYMLGANIQSENTHRRFVN